MIKQIKLTSGEVKSVSTNTWIDIQQNANNYNAITKSWLNDVQSTLQKEMNIDSKVYNLFKYNVDIFAFSTEKNVETFKDAEILINHHVRFTKIFDKEENNPFHNTLFKNREMHISESNKLVIHDYSRLIKNKNEPNRIDKYKRAVTIVQLYKIVNRVQFYWQAVEMLCAILNIKIIGKEMEIKQQEREKLLYNLNILETIKNYPNVYKLINKHIYILKTIQQLGIVNSFATSESYEADIIHLTTSTYLHNYLNNIEIIVDERYIRRLLLLYETLGLTVTVTPTKKLIDTKSNVYKNEKFYVIPQYTKEILEHAEEIAIKLRSVKCTASTISHKLISKALTNNVDKANDNNTDDELAIFFKDINFN